MAIPKLDNILLSLVDNIGIIKYNRPANANALDARTMSDLLEGLKWALNDSEVKVVLLTGEGKFFSAGMDLVGVPAEGPVLPDEGVGKLSEIHKLLINAKKVLIAAVNGPAVGYGTSSIALCDLVYAVPDAIFFTPFVKWGLCAEACSSVTFAKIMGRQKASSLILAGERMSAQELESAGMISKILPKEGFFDEVMTIARRIVAQPPGALEFSKQLMMIPLKDDLLAANERECEGLRLRSRTDEPRKAIAAFENEKKDRKKSRL